jgi:hypothetical protein
VVEQILTWHGPYGSEILCVSASRCEIIVDDAGFEWVHASNGDIPALAVPLARDLISFPLYMASVTDYNHNTLDNPADMMYVVSKGVA